MITERTLKRWRTDALRKLKDLSILDKTQQLTVTVLEEMELNDRILRLTQDLMDVQILGRIDRAN